MDKSGLIPLKKIFFHFGNMPTLRERPIKQNQTEKGC